MGCRADMVSGMQHIWANFGERGHPDFPPYLPDPFTGRGQVPLLCNSRLYPDSPLSLHAGGLYMRFTRRAHLAVDEGYEDAKCSLWEEMAVTDKGRMAQKAFCTQSIGVGS